MENTKKEIKKLTLTEVIKNKEQYQVKDDVTQELYIKRLGGSVVVKKPDRSLCLETMAMAQDKEQSDKSDTYIIYNMMVEPNLKDPQLQKAFDCVEPMDIVEKLFEIGEIAHIAQVGLELIGYNNSVGKVKDLKN